MSEPPVTNVDDVVVTARRDPLTNTVQLWWRYRSRDTGAYSSGRTGTGIGGLRFRPDVNIRFVDSTGEGIPITVNAAIPPESVEQLVQLMEAFLNEGAGFTASQMQTLGDALGAFTYLKSQNAGIQFQLKTDLPAGALMAARVDATTGLPVVQNGNATIWVSPFVANNPRNLGAEAPSLVIHEILHLNPDFGAADLVRWTRNGARPINSDARRDAYNRYHQSIFYGRARAIQRILRTGAVPSIGLPVRLLGTTGNDTLVGQQSFTTSKRWTATIRWKVAGFPISCGAAAATTSTC